MNRVQNLRLIAIAGRCLVALALFPQALLFAQDRQEPATLLTVWAGMLPIILSAPHGGRESISGVSLRRGIGVAQFTTERDNNTAALTEAVGNAISD